MGLEGHDRSRLAKKEMGVKKGKRKGLAVVSPKWQWLWWLVAGFGVRHWS